jgi:hypothetical protein
MSAATSDAEASVPGVVLATARARVRARVLATIASGLVVVLLCQAFLLGVLARRPLQRLYVSETTLVTPYSGENSR